MRYSVVVLMAALAMTGCKGLGKTNLPPADRMMHPGPGVDGPGPGVMMYQPAQPAPSQVAQVAFIGSPGMMVNWDVSAPGQFDSEPLTFPGRYNFNQGAIYRLKLTNVPGRPGVELFPTLELAPTLPRSAAFLAHNAVPVQFTEEDFDQVLSGNMVTKVIYLPDPEFQQLAQAGVGELVSTRLDPGVDPIDEADRRGAIMAVVRLGNRDLSLPGQGPGDVTPASFSIPCQGNPQGAAMGQPMGMNMPGGSVPSTYISGVTGPEYGMPMCGTPIGLPGPPHVPLGAPAGLQKHVIKNHTRVNLPKPTRKIEIDVKQRPGMSYPKPVDRVRIVEDANPGLGWFRQPLSNKHQYVAPEGQPCEGVPCETGTCPTAPCEGGYETAGETNVGY